ncbi:HK97 gp10 family phage protein [Alkalihalobacillus trypoxylicola]|uniref:Phage portal protein n=1 Tax=Alkalihalobacillus trypoxylicola TaxID=519424 RepID=A0A162EWE8_9BACI|nr:HK97 gp10 family phage protein [Alkalihalobacillus trypoxylicola]KYG33897.1 hypothetical protein AZF04_15405 [Alkalihalobacillus trypoxylicola]
MKIDGLQKFMKSLNRAANGHLKNEMKLWLEEIGLDFLDVVEDEIRLTEITDMNLLLNAFERGHSENVWISREGGLTLEIGTDVEYAQHINDGYFYQDSKNLVKQIWIPGIQKGDSFQYFPESNLGLMFTVKWMDGLNYWDISLSMFRKMFASNLEKKLVHWVSKNEIK